VTANDPPLIAGVIHGVRVWRTRLDGRRPRLAAAAQGSAWVPGGLPTRAACLVGEGHPAPAGECACGLYALHPHTLETTASFFSFPGYHRGALWIAGLVEAWGRIEVHAEGFRAQYARPIALLAMGLPRHGEYHRLAAEAAAAYRVELLQLESPAQVAAHCREHDLGLSREVVRSLVSEPPEDAPPTLVGAPTPPGPAPPRSRLQEIGELLGLGAFGLMMLVWYSGIGLILIASAIGMVSGLGDEGGSEFSSRHLRVLDERLVRFDGSLSYIAIVRDTSDEKVALAAFPRGKVVDADGEEVVSIQERERIDLRPSLGPGSLGS
jgi:hypothetical protein